MSKDQKTTESTALVTQTERITEMEAVMQECSLDRLGSVGSMQRALTLAKGVNRLRQLLTKDMMEDVMQLMNTPLGFLTDRDPNKNKDVEPYPMETVRDSVIEAKLKGFEVVGNEFNIIAGRFYGTKEGYIGKLSRLPGLSDLICTFGIVRIAPDNSKAIVPCSATWRFNGVKARRPVEGTEWEDVVVRLNRGQNEDAALGKAERKFRARIYAQITGSEQSDAENDPDVNTMKRVNEGGEAEARGSEAVLDKLKQQQAANGQTDQLPLGQ